MVFSSFSLAHFRGRVLGRGWVEFGVGWDGTGRDRMTSLGWMDGLEDYNTGHKDVNMTMVDTTTSTTAW
jgi:hypothetical protein